MLKKPSLDFNWELIEALESDKPVITQSSQGEDDKHEFTEEEACKFWIDALTEDEVPLLTEEMINSPEEKSKYI